MASELHVGVDFLAALRQYAQDVNDAVQEASNAGFQAMVDVTQAKAAESPRWFEAAQDIEVWTNEGRVWLGVRNAGSISEASAAEFGDPAHPPVPILRSFRDAQRAGQREFDAQMRRRVGLVR